MGSLAQKGQPSPDLPDEDFAVQNQDVSGSCRPGLAEKIERLSSAKADSLAMSEYIGLLPVEQQQAGELAKAGDVHACATWLDQRHYFEAGRVEYTGRRCHRHLLCRTCAIARGSRELARFVEQFEFSGASKLRQYVLTVTVKDGPDLAERFDHLVSCWRSRLQAGRAGKGWSELRRLAGGKYSLEFKRGKGSSTWHPHLHAFIVTDEELPLVRTWDSRKGCDVWRWPAFSEEWQRETGDSFILECHPVEADDTGGVMAAACEVFKYAVKVNELAYGDRLEAFRVLSGRRLLGSFGCFWGLEEMRPDQLKERRLVKESGVAWEAFLETAYLYISGVGYSAQAFKLRGAGEVCARGEAWQNLVDNRRDV